MLMVLRDTSEVSSKTSFGLSQKAEVQKSQKTVLENIRDSKDLD